MPGGDTVPKERRPDKQRCTAHSSRTGDPCKMWAIRGGTVCHKHGGRAPRVKAAAATKLVEQDIAKTLGRLTVVPIHDPLTALAELAGEITAWKELAAERVAALKELAQRNYATGADEVHAEIQVYERALDRCVHVLATIARLNIDERLVKISQQQADLVQKALLGALDDTGLPRDQQREAATHLARRLRLVAS
jgi:hypothetical protein